MKIHASEVHQALPSKKANAAATIAAKRHASRIITAIHDEEQRIRQANNNNAIISITGRHSDICRRYHIDPQVVGSGRHGVVRECTHRTTLERCAVKSIRKRDLSPNDLASLPREIAMLRATRGHQNIVRLVDVFEDAEYVHLITELCRGGELFDRIIHKSSNGGGEGSSSIACFEEDDAANIMRQILTAVAYMHENDIVHRDIKPENILLESSSNDGGEEENSSPVIKLVDFGLARTHRSKKEPPMRSLVGTRYYIAPEVLRKSYTKACDLFSCGVIAYVLMCGYPPFTGASADEVHLAILIGRYRFEEDRWRGVSTECKDFIRRLLQSDPRKRMTAEQALRHRWLCNNNERRTAASSR